MGHQGCDPFYIQRYNYSNHNTSTSSVDLVAKVNESMYNAKPVEPRRSLIQIVMHMDRLNELSI